jgi:hypothetical protein
MLDCSEIPIAMYKLAATGSLHHPVCPTMFTMKSPANIETGLNKLLLLKIVANSSIISIFLDLLIDQQETTISASAINDFPVIFLDSTFLENLHRLVLD